MRELLELLAKSLVDNPDQVSVEATEKDRMLVLELKVASEDMGKVIGKQGRVAKTLRTIVKAAATREGKKVIVDIV